MVYTAFGMLIACHQFQYQIVIHGYSHETYILMSPGDFPKHNTRIKVIFFKQRLTVIFNINSIVFIGTFCTTIILGNIGHMKLTPRWRDF
jgi:hypothetical protein